MANQLSPEEKSYLLQLARHTIEAKLEQKSVPAPNSDSMSDNLKTLTGCFVTLHKEGQLRGCIGYLEGKEPLFQAVIDNATHAAFSDHRFSPVKKNELPLLDIEITILTPAQPLEYADSNDLLDKIRPHIDGLIIKKGYHQATFLPQVWEQLPKKADFLTYLCNKAGMAGDEWKKGEMNVFTYQAYYFSESDSQ